MSSTNKTQHLRLNQWIGSDKPRSDDFNYDNQVIDYMFNDHTTNMDLHIRYGERDMWNTFTHTGVYYGNGNPERTIDTGCSFDASFVVVFANNRPASVTRFTDTKSQTYMAFACNLGSSTGVKMKNNGKQLTVTQSATAVMGNEYACMNESGVAYSYVLIK